MQFGVEQNALFIYLFVCLAVHIDNLINQQIIKLSDYVLNGFEP